MRKLVMVAICIFGIAGCDNDRVYEKNVDFPGRYWNVNEKPEFEFSIPDTSFRYNLYLNIRNEISYLNANIYFTYNLKDSTNRILEEKLVSEFLFDRKTGEPFGNSGLGDIYDHRFLMLEDYRFPSSGKHIMQFEQFMRTDSLQGILSVGLRVEKSEFD
jgi:gliding motility-associated lipoprotein GldH